MFLWTIALPVYSRRLPCCRESRLNRSDGDGDGDGVDSIDLNFFSVDNRGRRHVIITRTCERGSEKISVRFEQKNMERW